MDREPDASPAQTPGSGRVSQVRASPCGSLGRDWLGMKHPANRSGRLSYGRGPWGPQENRGSGSPLGLPCVQPSVKNRTSRPQPSLQMGGHSGSLDSKVSAPPPLMRTGKALPTPTGPGAHGLGCSSPSAPTPIKKFHGGCFLPAFEEKTLCLKLPLLCETGDLCFL